MFNMGNVAKRVQNSLLAVVMVVGGCLVSMPSYACLPPEAGEFLSMAGGIFGTVFAPGLGTAIGTAAGDMAGSALGCSGGSSASGGAAVDSGEAVKEVLRNWLADNKNAREEQRLLVKNILETNAHQMNQLLQMHREEFNRLVAMNENQRRDFLAELDKQRDSFERIIDKFKDYAAQGRVLDHETIMELLTGSREEREAMYQRHKVELDRMAVEYNEKVSAAQADRDAAMKQLTDMTQSLNRQLIIAQIAHAACSQSIDNITWCGIRYRNNPEKCTALEEKKRILCE